MSQLPSSPGRASLAAEGSPGRLLGFDSPCLSMARPPSVAVDPERSQGPRAASPHVQGRERDRGDVCRNRCLEGSAGCSLASERGGGLRRSRGTAKASRRWPRASRSSGRTWWCSRPRAASRGRWWRPALAAAGLPLAVVNPRQIRDFARALGRLAKTDPLDAAVIAHFAEAVRPQPRAVPDEAARALGELVARRRQIIGMMVAERRKPPTPDMPPACGSPLGRSASARRSPGPALRDRQRDRRRRPRHAGLARQGGPSRQRPRHRTQEMRPHPDRRAPRARPDRSPQARRPRRPRPLQPRQRQAARPTGHSRRRQRGRSAPRSSWRCWSPSAANCRSGRYLPAPRRSAERPPKVAIVACMRKLLGILNAIVRDQIPWQKT